MLHQVNKMLVFFIWFDFITKLALNSHLHTYLGKVKQSEGDFQMKLCEHSHLYILWAHLTPTRME